MAFIESLGKKISNAGQDALKKTKDIADTAKINSAIDDEEKFIRECQRKLGELYFEKIGKSDDSQLQNQIDAINMSIKKIDEYRQQIREIKGVDICDNCKSEIPINAAFCPNCGKQKIQNKPADEPENMMECPSCHTMIKNGLNFCVNCGAKLS